MSKQRDPKTGKFVRTKPDYKAMYEELQKEKEVLVQTLQGNYLRLEKENEELKQENIRLSNENRAFNVVDKTRHDLEYRLAFLLDHCPFWVKWMYKRKFMK